MLGDAICDFAWVRCAVRNVLDVANASVVAITAASDASATGLWVRHRRHPGDYTVPHMGDGGGNGSGYEPPQGDVINACV